MNFFNKIPTITYNDNMARNIMARAKLSDQTKSNQKLFFPYTMKEADRIDHLSNNYYGSPAYTWLIWFSNEIIDPYYDLPLSELEFHDFIVSKYGSVEIAQRKIKYYKNNWETDINFITTSAFNDLTNGTQKYWEPVLDYNLNVKGYRRKQEDQLLNTNKMASFEISGLAGSFKVGEEIYVNNTTYGFCVYADSSNITIQHVFGYFYSGSVLIGKESGATALITKANNQVITTLAYTESYYWSPVSFYEYEQSLNEMKKNILLMDAQFASRAEQELKRVMETS